MLPGAMFRVALPNGHEMLAHISARQDAQNFIHISVDDKVNVRISLCDLHKARITCWHS